MAESKKPAGKKSTAKKAPIERKIVSANSGETVQSAAAGEKLNKAPASGGAAVAVGSAEGKKHAGGLRIGAVVLWLVAIAFEVLTVLFLNGTLYLPGNQMMWLIIGVVLDLICVLIGSQLWKKANRYDPASEKNKVKFFLWNNMGIIAAVIAFMPLVILLLKDKELDPKTKKIVSAIAAVALVGAVAGSIDYNPVSQEQVAEQQAQVAQLTADGTVYWTPFGKRYHIDPNCSSLLRSATIYSGSYDEAVQANRAAPCSLCAESAQTLADTDTPDADAPDAEPAPESVAASEVDEVDSAAESMAESQAAA